MAWLAVVTAAVFGLAFLFCLLAGIFWVLMLLSEKSQGSGWKKK